MLWIRTNERWSSWVALAAMTLQVALSFGHIHLEKLVSNSNIARLEAHDAPSTQQSPSQHPANVADDFCAICATIQLVSSSFIPDAPHLPIKFAAQAIAHFSNFKFTFISAQRAVFESRAPPLA
jgi:hypothetical protein